jgi:FkbH-like protein
MSSANGKRESVKCVVWDLDNTLWKGVLSEGDSVQPRPGVAGVINCLDQRGILQSIASKNNHDDALACLHQFHLAEYFLYPQINWSSKAASIQTIATKLNLSPATFAFVDDEEFEREEVRFCHPGVLCLDASSIDRMLELPEMTPRFITDDSRLRRQLYLTEQVRLQDEDSFAGSRVEFLESLAMEFTITEAHEDDLKRAEELTVRTNQLNSTAYTYSFNELRHFINSPRHQLLICELVDKYGSYGKIGLGLVEMHEDYWVIKLLLMSCRVVSRGVGSALLTHIIRLANEANVRLRAEYVPNDRNRIMQITYKFAGFGEVERKPNLVVFEKSPAVKAEYPSYLRVNVREYD